MTRQQIIAAAVLDSGEYKRGQEANDNPFSTNRWVDLAVSDLCRITESAYLTIRTDIVDGQSLYCANCNLFYIESVTVTAEDGTLVPLALTQAYDANVYAPNYRADSPVTTGTPNSIVFQGANNYLLHPVPDYDADNGLVFRGFGVLTNAAWSDDDDECPLPERTHETIASYVATRLARKNEEYDVAQEMEALYQRGKGLFESEMRSLTDSHRHTFPTSRGNDYGFGDDISNL